MVFRRHASFFAFLLALLVTACGRERSYDVRGRVAGFGDDPQTLIVEHEDVPGLMPAMTMPFTARDSADLVGLATGEAVSFTLHVGGNESWIDEVRTIPDDQVAAHPAGEPDPPYEQRPMRRMLEVGDRVPSFELTTHADTTLRLSDLEGKAVLLTFIYTRCPLPDFCPLMSQRFAQLQPELQNRHGRQVHLVSVSFDTEHDTPEVLRAYGDRYTDDFSTWTFATGEPSEVRTLAERFGEFYSASTGDFVHNLVTVLIGPDRRVHSYWRGSEWRAAEVAAEVDEIMAEM